MSSDRVSSQLVTRPFDGASAVKGLLIAVGVGLALGALTAYGQSWLSDSTTSFANSAGPWSVAAFLVARHIRRLPLAAIGAILTLACCELGYAIATVARGGSNSTTTVAFWLTAAVLAGPPIGIAGAWSTTHDIRRGVGFAVIGGVLLGEGIFGWTTIADTTDWRYWAVESVIGAAVVLAAAARSRWPRDGITAVAVGGLTAVVVFAAARLV